MADPKKNNTIVDGIHGITNAIDTKNQSQKEELELFLGDNGNICSVLKDVLQQLENGININTINDESLGKKGGEDLSDENKKVKYLNASLKTSAKNVNDLKSDLSDRVGFAVLANKLDDHFAALLPLVGINGKTKDTKKEAKTKDKGREKKGGGGINLPFMKTFHKAVDGFKSIPGKITSSVKGVVGGIKTAITAPFKAVGSFFSKGLGMIKGVFTAIPNMFGKAINGLKEGFGKVIGGIKNVITAPFKAIGSVFSKIGGGIKSLFGGKKEGKTKVNAVAIVAGDATGAVEYTKSFMKLTKSIKKMKKVNIKKLKENSKDIKTWANSFNKDILSIKLDESTIKNFEKIIKSASKSIMATNFYILAGSVINKTINKLYSGDKKLGNIFKGLKNYAQAVNNLANLKAIQKLEQNRSRIDSIASVCKNIQMAAKSILLAYIPLKIINLLFKNEKSNIFDGLINYAKTLNNKIIENKEFPTGQKGKKLDKNISQFTHITKGLKKFAAQVILMAASMLLITPVLMILGPVLNKGLDRLSDTMKSIGKVLKTMKQNLKIGTILLGTLCLILLMPFIVLFTALMIPLLLLTGLAAALNAIKYDRIMTKFIDGLNKIIKKMDTKMIKGLLKAILVESLLIVFTILLLLATFFLVLALPFTVVSILTMLATVAIFALLMVVGKIAEKCLKGILATILASIALVIMGVALLVATIALAAVALIIVSVGSQILLSLAVLVVLFAAIFVLGFIAETVIFGAGATVVASIAIAIMGVSLLIAVICMAKVSEIIMSTGPWILLSLAALVVLFGAVVGLGFAAIFAIPMALLAAVASVSIALMAVSMLVAIVALSKIAVIMMKFGVPILLSFAMLAGIFIAITVAGALAIPSMIFAPLIMIAAFAMIPMTKALAIAFANMANLPDIKPVVDGMLSLVVVFGAVIIAGALAIPAMACALLLGLGVGTVAKTVQKAFIKFMAASVVASMFKPQPLVKGIMALALLTDIVRVLNFKPLKEKFKELESAVKHFPKPATALSLTLAMSLFKKDPIVSGLKALFELSKIQLFPFGGLKKKFKELSDGIKKAPDTKHIGKLTEAMDAFKNIDTSGVVNFATSFGSAFDSLTDSTKTIDELSNSIHSLNSELKALSKNGGAVNILKDIQSNAGEATIKDPGIQSAQMEGAAQGEAQAANGKPDKTLYDVCEALNNISNLINQLVSKSSSWMDGGKNERTYEYKAKAGS